MLHREGKATIFISLVVLTGLNALVFWLAPQLIWLQNSVIFISIVLLGIVLQFFRNPSFQTNFGDNFVLSPADGKVVVIEEVEEPEFFKGKRLQVSVSWVMKAVEESFQSEIWNPVNQSPRTITNMNRYTMNRTVLRVGWKF